MNEKNNLKTGFYSHNEDKIEFNFKIDLRAEDKIKFVNFVTEILVDDNFNWIIKDMIFDYGIINIFTDIDNSEIKDSSNVINQIENLLQETNIVEIVKANVVEGLIGELEDAVERNIEYRTGVHRNNFTDALSNLIKTVNKKINGINIEDMMALAQKFNGISGELTADKIVDAYAKSDIFRGDYEKMIKDRKALRQTIENIDKENKNK